MDNREKYLQIAVPIVSVVLAMGIGMILIAALGSDPFEAMGYLFEGAFGSVSNFASTLVRATPIIFTGLCACFAYRCGVFNLGGEGQFIMGSIAALWVTLSSGLEGVPALLLATLTGAIAGGLWGAIPGLLRIGRGLNEMIVSIMLNYVATFFMSWVFTDLLREGSTPQTAAVPEITQLPRISDDYRVTYGIVIALVLAVALNVFLFSTSQGFKLRAVGLNATAAKFNGFPVNRYILISFIVSGAIAGLGGSVEITGTQFRLMGGYAAGFGFDGVAMALIAQLNPLGTALVAYLFSVLSTGSTVMQVGAGVPTSVINIIQALVIIFAVAGTALVRLPVVRQLFQKRNDKRKEVAK